MRTKFTREDINVQDRNIHRLMGDPNGREMNKNDGLEDIIGHEGESVKITKVFYREDNKLVITNIEINNT